MNLEKDFGRSLVDNAMPVIREFSENEIDKLISDGVFRSVPILNTISGLIRIGKDFSERNLLKQTAAFCAEFKSGIVDSRKLTQYKSKLKNDKKAMAELERVLLLLDRNIEEQKSRYLARLFAACVNGRISWDAFCEYADITSRFYMEDYRILRMFWDRKSVMEIKADDEFRIERIYSTGIVGINPASIGNGAHIIQGRKLNHMGELYCDIIFK